MAAARKFEAVPAIRKAVPLLIGIAGPPGAGKTYSALELATGIAAHRGGPIVALDTERNRMLSYAPPMGVKADGVNHFDFMHVPFAPPFGSLDFLDAVMQQRAHKPSCIIIDSFSDEHEGDGGLLDFHDTELDRMAGEDYGKRQAMGQAAWIKPKQRRLEMMNGLFQIMTPLIFCFRAREKTKQIANDRGKQVPTNIGWTPIAPPEIVHNMTLFALLPIKSDGVPMWKGNTAYEDFSIKLPRAFQGMFPENERISRKMGHAMSTWALGDQKLADQDGERQTGTAAEKPLPQSARAAEARAPADEPASSASDAGTETVDGTPGSGDTTTTASENAGPGPIEAGDEAGSHAPAQSGPSEPPEAVATFLNVVAGAKDWPTIREAIAPLKKSPAWQTIGQNMQIKIHTIGFHRLQELVADGYRFDFLDDLHAYRFYIDQEQDEDALIGNRRVIHSQKFWLDLATDGKVVFDRAHDAQVARIRAGTAGGPSPAEFS